MKVTIDNLLPQGESIWKLLYSLVFGIVRSLPGVNRNRVKEMENEVDRTSYRPTFQRSNREFEGRPSQEGK
jgi:hypothetical protein